MIKYVGVDWLTMTSKEDAMGETWYRAYVNYRKAKEKDGDKEETWNNGFYFGLRIAQQKWGYREDLGYIWIISGEEAERQYHLCQPAKHRITRLDLAVDFMVEKRIILATMLYGQAVENNTDKRRKYSLFHNSDGGETFYVGSRQSVQYGRVYDKGVQSGREDPGWLFRAEVELKKPVAGLIAKQLSEREPKQRKKAIQGTVLEWFRSRSVSLPQALDNDDLLDLTVTKTITTNSKKMAWLSSQVRPSVVQLVEAGLGKEVMNTLLLDLRTIKEIFKEEI